MKRLWGAASCRVMVIAIVAAMAGGGRLAHAQTTRETRPTTISGTGNVILPSVGIEVARQVSDRVALAVQLTQLLWAHIDLSARVRVFAVAGETSGLYLGPNVHAWYSPLILHGVVPVVSVEAGYEYRAKTGFTIGTGLAIGVLWEIAGDAAADRDKVQPLALLNVRLGGSR